MQSKIIKAKVYITGSCKSYKNIALSSEKLQKTNFLALSVYFEVLFRGKILNVLFDSGYSKHFFNATAKFPNKLYALITPVKLKKSLKELLEIDGINKIDYIFISHFHADHIGGLLDFKDSFFVSSKSGFKNLFNKNNLLALKNGFLKELIPDDFLEKLVDIESLTKVKNELFDEFLWLDVFRIFRLDGHAKAQFGLAFKCDDLEVLLVSDAVWDIKSIEENIKPSKIANLLFDDSKKFYETLEKLQIFSKQNPNVLIVPSHCESSINKLVKGLKNA